MSPLISLAVFAVVGAGVSIFWLKRLANQSEKRMREQFPAAKAIVRGANFFGQESRGKAQLRGNGTFVLTDTEIVFERWVPRAEFRIPFAAIQTVDTANAFLGKRIGRKLLHVRFRSETGDLDSMAWYVPDLHGLMNQIERLKSHA